MKKPYLIDLHTHSNYSIDGSFSPIELVDIALNNKINYLAISDHDCVSAIDTALEYSADKDITLIPACEISSSLNKDISLHILAYGIDYKNPLIEKRCQSIISQQKEWGKKIIDKTLSFGFKFDPENVYKVRTDGLVCEELIGQEVLNDERNNNDQRLSDLRDNGPLSDNPPFNFYKKFFGNPDCPCYVNYDWNMPIKDVVELVHSANGKIFLAHPAYNIGLNEDILKSIIDLGLDGIEVFSSYHNQQATDFFYEMASKYNLFMSAGSDFHGKSKPSIQMGSSKYDEKQLLKTLDILERKL